MATIAKVRNLGTAANEPWVPAKPSIDLLQAVDAQSLSSIVSTCQKQKLILPDRAKKFGTWVCKAIHEPRGSAWDPNAEHLATTLAALAKMALPLSYACKTKLQTWANYAIRHQAQKPANEKTVSLLLHGVFGLFGTHLSASFRDHLTTWATHALKNITLSPNTMSSVVIDVGGLGLFQDQPDMFKALFADWLKKPNTFNQANASSWMQIRKGLVYWGLESLPESQPWIQSAATITQPTMRSSVWEYTILRQVKEILAKHPARFSIAMQVPLYDYRIDILITAIDSLGKKHTLVVECNGDIYHAPEEYVRDFLVKRTYENMIKVWFGAWKTNHCTLPASVVDELKRWIKGATVGAQGAASSAPTKF